MKIIVKKFGSVFYKHYICIKFKCVQQTQILKHKKNGYFGMDYGHRPNYKSNYRNKRSNNNGYWCLFY